MENIVHENTTWQNLLGTFKAIIKRNFIIIHIYINKNSENKLRGNKSKVNQNKAT